MQQEFAIYTNHRALKFLNSVRNIDNMHMKWTNFLQKISFVIKHKSGVTNYVADALSRKGVIHTMLFEEIVSLKCLKELNKEDEDFENI